MSVFPAAAARCPPSLVVPVESGMASMPTSPSPSPSSPASPLEVSASVSSGSSPEALLDAERRRSAALADELQALRAQLLRNSVEAEAEEEFLINKLNKKLTQLLGEKERLAQEVEREEELITNTLQKQLAQLRRDKVDLENRLEQEQECMVNKLQRRVAVLEKEKDEALRRRREEKRREQEFVHDCLAILQQPVEKAEKKDPAAQKEAMDAMLTLQRKFLQRHSHLRERKDSSVSVATQHSEG